MEWYEAAFDRLYPVMYPHRDATEAEQAMDTYAHLFEDRTPVLDLACGNGRYLSALLARGITTFGLDLSHYLLLVAVNERDLRGSVVQGDMRALPFHDGAFGGVLNMFTSFGYFSVDTDNLLVFREVSRLLRREGVFLLDFINAGRIGGDLLGESRRQSGAYDVQERRHVEGHGKYLVKRASLVHTETGAREEIEERLRLYSRNDLEIMLESVGLVTEDVFGDYAGNPFVEGVSDRVVIVSRKK